MTAELAISRCTSGWLGQGFLASEPSLIQIDSSSLAYTCPSVTPASWETVFSVS